jgi:hypothetical protein
MWPEAARITGTVTQLIDLAGHYSPNDLYNKIINGLNKLGKDLSKVTLDDLQPVDEFHIRDAITSAGFDIQVWNDKTGLAQKAFADATEPVGEPSLPALGVYLLVGNDIQSKAYNLHRNLDEERVSLIETLAVRPDGRA